MGEVGELDVQTGRHPTRHAMLSRIAWRTRAPSIVFLLACGIVFGVTVASGFIYMLASDDPERQDGS